LQANSLATIALTLGCILAGRLIDKIGGGWTFILGSSLLGTVIYYFYSTVLQDPSTLYGAYALAGFSVGLVGAVPYVMANAFPATVRFTGLSFSYNVAYAIFGGLTPMMVS
ncbi:MFS transporter, partial [Undibacterium sp. LFS511W]|nr:MFS transporter [Undibacterium luofuense]